MNYNSEAYYEGLKSGRYDTNPYEECSDEFDEYEKGVTQKLKRTPSDELNAFFITEDAEVDEQRSNGKLEGHGEHSNKYRKKRDGI